MGAVPSLGKLASAKDDRENHHGQERPDDRDATPITLCL